MSTSRVVFMGTPAFAVPSLNSLAEAGFDVAAVVTQPDRPRGRGKRVKPSPVKAAAQDLGLEVLEPESVKDADFIEKLRSLGPEYIAVVAYGKILPAGVLNLPPGGCVNVHASLLPRYRGAAPINWAIVRGEKESGVTTMLMDEGMDTGPVLLEEKVSIEDTDTAEDLAKKLSVAGGRLLVKTLELLKDGKVTPRPQDKSKATYAPMLKKSDGRIDWTKPAIEIHNLVRGFYPWPGAHTTLGGKRVKIHSSRVAREDVKGGPGSVKTSGGRLLVGCGEGALEITELQPENKRRMAAADFLTGRRIDEGEKFV